MAAQLPYLPPILSSDVNDIANVAASTARDVQAQNTGAGKAGVVVRGVLPYFLAAAKTGADVMGYPGLAHPVDAARTAAGTIAGPIQDFGRAVLGLPQATPGVSPATHGPVISGSPDDTSQVLKVSTDPSGTTVNGQKRTGAAYKAPAQVTAAPATTTASGSSAAPAAPALSGLPVFISHSPALAIAEGYHQQAQYAAAQRDAVLAGAERAAATGNPNNASYRYAAALHALPTLSGSNNFGALQANGAINLNDVTEKARASEITAGSEAARTGVLAEANRLHAQEIRRNAQFVKIGEIPNPDAATRIIKPTIDVYGYQTMEDGKIVVRNLQGQVLNDNSGATSITGAAATPSVGSKVKQADGEYSRGGKTYVVKNGVITEIK